MTTPPTQAPVLSTPDTHIFEYPTLITKPASLPKYTEEELWDVYEIERTAREVRHGGYSRVALQFPDAMLRDAPRIFEALEKEVEKLPAKVAEKVKDTLETSFNDLSTTTGQSQALCSNTEKRVRFYILADTSYGSCCVDEIAAEHVNADVVVHYGRSCLSPTARLPVIYVFSTHSLDISSIVHSFKATYPEKGENVVLMADITYHNHVAVVKTALVEKGYTNVTAPEIIHDPSSLIPNRRLEEGKDLKEYSLFHISDPPDALLLTLSSRVKSMFIYPTSSSSASPPTALEANTTRSLRRRYALLASLSTCPIFGILINTLSVRNYLSTVSSIQSLISHSGKKSYTFVVGKVNAAKIANFSEIGGWVVVGCWESSLIESAEFYRGIITPFELGLALMEDRDRVWDGSWEGDFSGFAQMVAERRTRAENVEEEKDEEQAQGNEDEDSEEESAPPEFDLRTGRYVSHSRPMRTTTSTSTSIPQAESSTTSTSAASQVLTRRAKGELATINGAVSPGAEYLRSQRTWTGLGSDFDTEDASQSIEEGRSGVARGYRVGEDGERT
jgi:diphthamide biosynthesis protein 2